MIGLCMVNTGLFIYPSLSQYFSIVLLSFFSLTSLFFYMFIKKEKIDLSKTLIIMFLWAVYIVLQTLSIPHGAYYDMYLMLSYFCFFLSVFESFRLKIISKNGLMYIFFFWGIIESVICLIQYAGIIGSPSKYFNIAGSLENPNVTAMFITACFPFGIFYFLRRHKYWGIILNSLLFIALLLLECRTAYLGLLIVIVVFLISNKKIKDIIGKLSKKSKIIYSVLILAGALFVGSYLYLHKKESADGRLFIWKLSAQMITSKPVFGYGYGLFERNYNIYQSNYFKSGYGSEKERENADHVNMAYNEYIEQWINGGIIGLFFYLSILVLLFWVAVKQKNKEIISITAAIVLMGFSNFIVQAIPVWLLFLTYLASISEQEKKTVASIRKPPVEILLVCSVLGIGLIYESAIFFDAQYTLKQAFELSKEQKMEQASQLLKQHVDKAGASEVYLRNFGKSLIFNKNYSDAILILKKASYYTSNPDVFYSLAFCYIQNEQYKDAENALYTVAYMIPTNLKSRYQLMLLYDSLNQTEQANQMANEIVNMQPKVITKEGTFYKEAAKLNR